MGSVKELLFEMQEQERDKALADSLGISYDELTELEWSIETDESDDGLIYNYRVEFSADSPKDILSKIESLEDGCRVYLQPWELDNNYDYDEEFDAITEDKDYVRKYKDDISKLEALCHITISDDALSEILNRQIYISIIGTMETFLSDAFVNLTFDNDIYFKNFIESHPKFKKRKFDLSNIYVETDKLKETAKKVMLDTIYHNLPVVKVMYQDTFKISFPDIRNVYSYVIKRHDLVHRNGKSKEGKKVETDQKAIHDLIQKVNELVEAIISKLQIL